MRGRSVSLYLVPSTHIQTFDEGLLLHSVAINFSVGYACNKCFSRRRQPALKNLRPHWGAVTGPELCPAVQLLIGDWVFCGQLFIDIHAQSRGFIDIHVATF